MKDEGRQTDRQTHTHSQIDREVEVMSSLSVCVRVLAPGSSGPGSNVCRLAILNMIIMRNTLVNIKPIPCIIYMHSHVKKFVDFYTHIHTNSNEYVFMIFFGCVYITCLNTLKQAYINTYIHIYFVYSHLCSMRI